MAQDGKGSRYIDEDEDADFDAVLAKKADRKSFGILPKVVAFLLAVIVWMFVMEINPPDVRETYENIPVVVLNSSGMKVEPTEGESFVVSVIVTGKKNRIHALQAKDITVAVDLTGITESGKYELEVQCTLPVEYEVYRLSDNTITVMVEVPAGDTQ